MTYKDSYQAWLIAVATSLLTFLACGNTRQSGVMFIPLMESEHLDRGTASWPFSLVGATSIVAAPLTGFLLSRFSPVYISLFGSFLFVVGQLPGYFTTNIYVLSIFYGIIKGFGIGLIFTVGAIVTSTSFNRLRSTAMGLSLVGGSIGGVLFPILAQYMLMEYGIRDTFLLMAGISMNSIPFSLAYFWYRDNDSPLTTLDKRSISKIEDERTPLLSSFSGDKTTVPPPDTDELCIDPTKSDLALKCRNEKLSERDNNKLLPKEREKGDTITDPGKSQANSQANNLLTTKKLFTNRGFCIVLLNQTLIPAVITIFAQVLLDYLKQKGISETTSVYMLSLVSFGDIIGKVCFGMILDKKILSFANFMALFLVLGAAAYLLLVFSVSIPVLLIVAITAGATAGTLISANLVMVTEYTSKEEIALAQSFLHGFDGLGILGTAPVIGLFRDTLESYEYLYYFLTVVQLALALINFIEGIYFKLIRKREAQDSLVRTIANRNNIVIL